MPRRLVRRLATVALATALVGSVAACDPISFFPSQQPATVQTTPANPATESALPSVCGNYTFDSVFSAYGSVHYTLLLADQLTLYLDMYTEQKTHEWFPSTKKDLSFTIRVVDSSVPLRAKFALKRRVYMGQITIDATTQNAAGQSGINAYSLNADPRAVTLDPEALQDKVYGLLITQPKGGFELDHIVLKAMPSDTVGFNMNFTMQLSAETVHGSKKYATHLYSVTLPVAVFSPSTANESSSCATNATLEPERAPGV